MKAQDLLGKRAKYKGRKYGKSKWFFNKSRTLRILDEW
jgi:hypothetical protein